MVEKKKRKHLSTRGDVKSKTAVLHKLVEEDVEEREVFGERTFAGALEAVRGVLERANASGSPKTKSAKKG